MAMISSLAVVIVGACLGIVIPAESALAPVSAVLQIATASPNAGAAIFLSSGTRSAQGGVAAPDSEVQISRTPNASAFAAQAAPVPDVTVDASQTLSETGGDDLAAARNIYASASSPESNGGLSDWSLISSELAMKRMRIINALGDCALDASGTLAGCARLNDSLSHVKQFHLSPHVVVGQWVPSSIAGNPFQWGAAQWAQYDALSRAIVNYVVNEFAGAGFDEALFEVGNELEITPNARDLWLTTTPFVPQGDPSRFVQYDTVYSHWAKAVRAVAEQNPAKKIRIAGPATGLWTVEYAPGPLWHIRMVQDYAARGLPLDVVSLHIYGFDASLLAKNAQSIRNTLNASGNSKAEIWVTEWGASSSTDSFFGAINASHQGAAWAIYFLLQALKGGITGGSFLQIRDNQGADIAGVNSNLYLASWNHVENRVEYPKPIANAMAMVTRMAGARKMAATSPAMTDLRVLASSDARSASVVVANYNYLFDYNNKKYSDLSRDETVTVAIKNLPFRGPVTVDRYAIDAQTSNLNYWVAAGKLPPSLHSVQLQEVESFKARSKGGVLTLPATQLGPSAVSLWIVHR